MIFSGEHGPKVSKDLFPLVHDLVHAESGQQQRALVLDPLLDSGAGRIVEK